MYRVGTKYQNYLCMKCNTVFSCSVKRKTETMAMAKHRLNCFPLSDIMKGEYWRKGLGFSVQTFEIISKT